MNAKHIAGAAIAGLAAAAASASSDQGPAEAGGGSSSATSGGALPAKSDEVNVAYHDGPPAMGFYGRRWVRNVSQPVSAADWEAMQARHDCAPHDFRVV